VAQYSSSSIGYLLVGQYNLTGISSKLEDSIEAPIEDVTPFGANTVAYGRPGFKKYALSGHEGWYDDAADSINEAMIGMASTEEVFMMAYQGNTAGKMAVCAGGAIRAGYKRGFEVGQYHKASFDLSISGTRDEAIILAPLAVYTGNGNTESTYLDLNSYGGSGSPSGTLGCTLYVCITSFTQSTSSGLVITFEDSTTTGSFVSQCATANITAPGITGYKVVSSDTTVNRYIALKWAWGGTVGSAAATFTAAVAINR
jgi:hypothetical protein